MYVLSSSGHSWHNTDDYIDDIGASKFFSFAVLARMPFFYDGDGEFLLQQSLNGDRKMFSNHSTSAVIWADDHSAVVHDNGRTSGFYSQQSTVALRKFDMNWHPTPNELLNLTGFCHELLPVLKFAEELKLGKDCWCVAEEYIRFPASLGGPIVVDIRGPARCLRQIFCNAQGRGFVDETLKQPALTIMSSDATSTWWAAAGNPSPVTPADYTLDVWGLELMRIASRDNVDQRQRVASRR